MWWPVEGDVFDVRGEVGTALVGRDEGSDAGGWVFAGAQGCVESVLVGVAEVSACAD